MSDALPITVRAAAHLRDLGPATITELARALEVSRTSAEKALTALKSTGLTTTPIADAAIGAGRPARRYAFDAAAGSVIGIDIGAASVRVLICDLAGVVLRQQTFPGITSHADGAAQLSAVIRDVRAALEGFPPPHAVGVSLPGIVDDTGRVIASVVIPEWSGVSIGDRLHAALDCPVSVDNGVRLAAVAEHHLGAAQYVDDLIYISVGHRIAMGMLLGGIPRRGVHHAAGDIGRLAFQELTDSTGELRWDSAASGAEVFSRAAEGDADAQAELNRFIEKLSHGIAISAMSVDPAMIVIGGGLSEAHDQLIVPLRAALARQLGMPFSLSLTEARLGAAAAAHGALVLAFERLAGGTDSLAGMPTPAITPLDDAARS